ncbi:hypothetical protein ACFLQW_03270 [Candidatus Zixiibacteriota bacterium]
MPYTERELVKKHLVDFRVGQAEIKGFSLVLVGVDPVQLPHSGLVETSIVVKANESSTPAAEMLIPADDWVSLAHPDIVVGSVVVADNTSLSTIYAENVDYTIDYDDGRLRRIAGGSIASGQSAAVWYFFYRRYLAGTDYVVDSVAGRLRRLSAGVIEDGQAVLVDYAAGFGAITEESIDQAIDEADQAILQIIDAQYHDATDPGLVAAETHWAVSILCRVRAAAELSGPVQKTTAAASSARAWLDLSEQYQHSAERLLKPFRGAIAVGRCPTFVSRH